MKILVVGRGYPTLANRMWGSFELEQAKLLARNGHDVSYIALTLSFFNRKDPRGMRFFVEDGVKVYAYSQLYFPGKIGIYWERFEDSCWKRLYLEAGKRSGLPDIIHIHYPSMLSGVNVVEQYRKRGVKIFATEHWSRVLINTLKKHERKRLEYYACHANCLACVGESLEKAIRTITTVTVPMEIIPNIVSPIFFITPKEKSKNVITFISVGRLVSLKQFDVVIEQFLKMFKGQSNVRLRIIGSGEEKSKLEVICKGDQRISFLGEISLTDVKKEIDEADALVSFSKYETFAVPVTEAWACGKPVIVSDKSGVASYVNKERGIVVSADSQDELGKALKRIYLKHGDYSSEKISNFAKKNFSDKAIMSKLDQMYRTY